jgi:hypothetical protein
MLWTLRHITHAPASLQFLLRNKSSLLAGVGPATGQLTFYEGTSINAYLFKLTALFMLTV